MERELTEKKTDEPCCGNCKFFRDIGVREHRVEICALEGPKVTHVFAPKQTLQGMEFSWQSFSGWPTTMADRWCGKHERVKH